MPPVIAGDLFRQLRTAAREAAGVPWYDPSEPAINDFPPTLRDAVAGLDRSTPPYLRCDLCGTKLIRGLQSTICVYCGTEPRREFPISVSFSSTVAYRKLLESLDLDGSELVTLNATSKDLNKAKDVSGEEVVLSSLFDLELKWPREERKVESSSASQAPPPSTHSLNLSGIDLDNFFSEVRIASTSSVPNASQETFQEGEILSKEASESSDSRGLDDFDSLRSSKIAGASANTEGDNFDDHFADWDASFQAAGSVNTVATSISTDLFEDQSKSGSSEIYIDADGGVNTQPQQNDLGHSKSHENHTDHVSPTDDWTEDDEWQSADVNVSSSVDQKNPVTHGSIKEDLWHGGSAEASISVEKMDDDSFDIWQDFTSSQGVSDVPSNPWPGNNVKNSYTNEAVGEKNSNGTPEDMEFGDFLQSDSLSVKSDLLNSKDQQFKAADFNSLNPVDVKSIHTNTMLIDSKSEYIFATAEPQPDSSSQSSVEALLLQMHDLSFMLESNLCIPKTASG